MLDDTTLAFTVDRIDMATIGLDPTVCDKCVNRMDQLNGFVVFHADTMGIASDYDKITLKLDDQTEVTLTETAYYDEESNQLSLALDPTTAVNLPHVLVIELGKTQ